MSDANFGLFPLRFRAGLNIILRAKFDAKEEKNVVL
jgi:hypothetical protein